MSKPMMAGTKKHVLRVPLPWTRDMYALNHDAIVRCRAVFMLAWWSECGYVCFQLGWYGQPV